MLVYLNFVYFRNKYFKYYKLFYTDAILLITLCNGLEITACQVQYFYVYNVYNIIV